MDCFVTVRKSILILLSIVSAVLLRADFLVQGCFSFQMPFMDSIGHYSGYKVNLVEEDASPYDVSVGYMFSFRDVAVMPVMIEAKPSTLETYLNPSDVSKADFKPLEILLKPGLHLTNSDVYLMMGYQVGEFKQEAEENEHSLSLKVLPSFYGAGYTKGLSDYLDYLAEVKVYYHSDHAYGVNFESFQMASDFEVSDARVRVGFRFKI